MTADRGDLDRQDELRRELIVHHDAAFAWAKNCCRRDRSEAEEVLQVSYLKVLEGRARFDRRSSFRTWLFGVIHRTAADHRRRRALRDLVGWRWGAEEGLREPAPGADAGVEQAQQRAQLEGALAALPRRQREVLQLVFHHELTVEDAAAVMAVGVGSARQHYARGKVRLRQLLSASAYAR
jgi:RNA polymerase sigma-70 factor (ECF subfamily)